MNRIDILNCLIEHFKYRSYLEIGVDRGACFHAVRLPAANKIGVDPNCRLRKIHRVESDAFFAENTRTFDLIFIDGLHYQAQLLRDISNSLEALNPSGTIVCHDINPESEELQIVPRTRGAWTGDCWKAWVQLRASRTDLFMAVVNADFGCGIIWHGEQKTITLPECLDWNALERDRVALLNLIPPAAFFRFLTEKKPNWKPAGS